MSCLPYRNIVTTFNTRHTQQQSLTPRKILKILCYKNSSHLCPRPPFGLNIFANTWRIKAPCVLLIATGDHVSRCLEDTWDKLAMTSIISETTFIMMIACFSFTPCQQLRLQHGQLHFKERVNYCDGPITRQLGYMFCDTQVVSSNPIRLTASAVVLTSKRASPVQFRRYYFFFDC